MVPIEYLMLMLWLLFALVGVARRFPKELGATVGFVGMLLLFNLGGGILFQVAGEIAAILDMDANLVTFSLYSFIIIAIVAALYTGETLTYSGVWPPSPLAGTAMDIFIALVNGWLVIGTWWFYMHRLGYPQQRLGMFTALSTEQAVSPVAERLVNLTPLALIPEGQATWIIGMALLGLLGLKVAR